MLPLLRIKHLQYLIISAGIFFLCVSADLRAADIETNAPYAYMVDFNTGTVLLSKNSDEAIPPSSMSKLMTAYMVFDALKNDIITLDSKFMVSRKAWKKGGSKMFVRVGREVRVEDLIRGILIQSGNDACIVLAEGLSGSEENFAKDMTIMAKRLGLENSTFINSTGWPDEDHKMSVKDIAILSEHLIRDFPEYYHYFAEESFTHNDIKQPNRNRLLYKNMGVDGLKTGYTEAGGYGIVTAAEQDGRRIILVVNGLESSKARVAESVRLMRYGFRDFKNVALLSKGDIVEEAEVWFGAKEKVSLFLNDDIVFTVNKRDKEKTQIKAIVEYEGPISAPIEKGQKIAKLIVSHSGGSDSYPLYASEDIKTLGFVGKFFAKLKYYMIGK